MKQKQEKISRLSKTKIFNLMVAINEEENEEDGTDVD